MNEHRLVEVTTAWGVTTEEERVKLVGKFLAATTRSSYEELAAKYRPFFGFTFGRKGDDMTLSDLLFGGQAQPEDIQSVCELLRTARDLFALYHSDGPMDLGDLLRLNVSPVFFEVNDAPSGHLLSFNAHIKGALYAEWLERASEIVNDRMPAGGMVMRFSWDSLQYSATMRGSDASDPETWREDVADILTQLFNIHLVDVATAFDGATAHTYQTAYSGVSTLWLGLSELLSGGRSFRCEACGRPFVAYGERRTRLFCTPACRKWANKHPGQKREHWYIEKL